MPNEVLVKDGTTITYTSSGGDKAITLSSMANDTAREGVKCDLGATRAKVYTIDCYLKTGTSPIAGKVWEIWWGASRNATAGSDNPGGLSGADAAYTGYTTGKLDMSLPNLQYVGAVQCTDISDQIHHKQLTFIPKHRYGIPVVVNRTGVTTNSTGTDHKLVVTPVVDEVQ